jgi:hypothetical protein
MSHQELPDAGLIPHQAIDRLLGLFTTGQFTFNVDVTDISNPPTDAELDAIFGTPTEAGAGFIRLIDDAAAGSNLYLVVSDGSNWWYFTAAKAV